MEGIEHTCYQIISSAGMAKSSYIEAIDFACDGIFDKAEAKIKEGDEYIIQGHKAHASMIQKEAAGNKTEIILLLVHAEDQFMSAETLKILAEKFIALHRKLDYNEKNKQ